jgi:hypothetical protein
MISQDLRTPFFPDAPLTAEVRHLERLQIPATVLAAGPRTDPHAQHNDIRTLVADGPGIANLAAVKE